TNARERRTDTSCCNRAEHSESFSRVDAADDPLPLHLPPPPVDRAPQETSSPSPRAHDVRAPRGPVIAAASSPIDTAAAAIDSRASAYYNVVRYVPSALLPACAPRGKTPGRPLRPTTTHKIPKHRRVLTDTGLDPTKQREQPIQSSK
ncbi:Os07g0571000, partial [Oryza sativa Japonica Group]